MIASEPDKSYTSTNQEVEAYKPQPMRLPGDVCPVSLSCGINSLLRFAQIFIPSHFNSALSPYPSSPSPSSILPQGNPHSIFLSYTHSLANSQHLPQIPLSTYPIPPSSRIPPTRLTPRLLPLLNPILTTPPQPPNLKTHLIPPILRPNR